MSTQPNAIQEIQAKSAAPAQLQTPQPQQPVQAAPQDASQPDDDSVSADSDETGKEVPTKLHKAFSHLNAAVTALFDGLGVPRVATIPHQDGQQMAEHLGDVQRVLSTAGGLTKNLVTATHDRYATGGGSTVAHNADRLRETVVPKDSELAKTAIASCKSLVNQVARLIGEDDPAVKLAKSQLALIGKQDGAGMSALDLGVALLNVPGPVISTVARKHSGIKPGGHAVHLRAPYEPQQTVKR